MKNETERQKQFQFAEKRKECVYDMRKSIVLIAVLLIFCLAGCSYSAAKTYYRDTADYDEIWELTGFDHGYEDQSPLFPTQITDLHVDDFYCRYDEQLPLGEGVQVFLKVLYDENGFLAEQERISEIAARDKKNFSEDSFSAYSLKMSDQGRWEYALLDDSQKAVFYIFLYNLPGQEIEIDKALLPQNYVDYVR